MQKIGKGESCVQLMGLATNYMWSNRERETWKVLPNLRTFEREEYGECSGSRIKETTGNMSGV